MQKSAKIIAMPERLFPNAEKEPPTESVVAGPLGDPPVEDCASDECNFDEPEVEALLKKQETHAIPKMYCRPHKRMRGGGIFFNGVIQKLYVINGQTADGFDESQSQFQTGTK